MRASSAPGPREGSTTRSSHRRNLRLNAADAADTAFEDMTTPVVSVHRRASAAIGKVENPEVTDQER